MATVAPFTRIKTINPGSGGERPPLHSRCIVHYVGTLVETGEVFMDTRAEGSNPAVVIAGRKSSAKEVGLNLLVAEMTPGERAVFRVPSDYGYGPKGNFSFPSVPPDMELEYDVELMGFDPVVETKEMSGLTFEARVDCAERRKVDGNTAFSAGEWRQAESLYQSGLAFVPEDLTFQVEGPHLAALNATRHALLLNLAACQLKLEEWNIVIETCGQVLREGKNAKALYRRGIARRHLGQTELARADLEAAQKEGMAHDPALMRELQLLKGEEKKERAASAKIFKGALKKGALSDENDGSGAAPSSAAPSERQQNGGGAATISSPSNSGLGTRGKGGENEARQRTGAAASIANGGGGADDPFSEIQPAQHSGEGRGRLGSAAGRSVQLERGRNGDAGSASRKGGPLGIFWVIVAWIGMLLKQVFMPFLGLSLEGEDGPTSVQNGAQHSKSL